MGLSSNILWHQTDKNSLKNILKVRGLFYAYPSESIPGVNLEIAFPMISLCDICFSDLSEYLNKYNGYLLGLSREWGVQNGFNPVMYCEAESLICRTLIKSLSTAISDEDSHTPSERLTYMSLLSYVKVVEGPLPDKGIDKYRFYDEREIRLVLPFCSAKAKGCKPLIVGKESVQQYKDKHGGKKHLFNGERPIGRSFKWDDIKYLIVESESDAEEFRGHLDSLGCSNKSIVICTHDQVMHDFIGVGHFEKQPITNTVQINDEEFVPEE